MSGSEIIEISASTRERFDEIREKCKDEFTPAPTDDEMMQSLMDTWDAVDDGHYNSASGGESEGDGR